VRDDVDVEGRLGELADLGEGEERREPDLEVHTLDRPALLASSATHMEPK
jgi:hypothetical protein